MKTTKICIIFLLITFVWISESYAQENIYVKLTKQQVSSLAITKRGNKKRVRFNQPNLNRIFQNLDLNYFEQAYPLAKMFDDPLKEGILRVYKLKGNFNNDSIYNILNSLKLFEVVQINKKPITTYVPNDFAQLPNTNQGELDVIKAKQAWDITKGNSNVKIAVIDNGFDTNHEDLASQIVYTYGNVEYVPTPESPNSHGNSTAGLAAAATNNDKGLSSIGFNSKLMLYAFGDIYNKMMHASLNGAKVINCSFFNRCNTGNPAQQSIINMIVNNGTVIVAAASNGDFSSSSSCQGDWDNDGIIDNHGYAYPASYDNVISVSGTRFNDKYIEQGASYTFNDKVDITAPGAILDVLYDNNSYGVASGTSGSSPMVTGTVALLFDVKPCISPADVEYILKQSADKSVNDLNIHPENTPFFNRSGAGRLDAFEAVKFAQNYPQSILGIASISGPSAVCISGNTFKLLQAPNVSISWNKSSNLTEVSGQGTPSYTVKAANDNIRASGWVEVTITGDCGSVTLPRQNIWVGRPPATLGGSITPYHSTAFPGELVTYTQIGGSSEGTYDWTLPRDVKFCTYCWTVFTGGSGADDQIRALAGSSSGYVQVRKTNACGNGGANIKYVTVSGGGGGGPIEFRISPNPTPNTELNVSFYSRETGLLLDAKDFNNDIGYIITNMNGKIKHNSKSRKKSRKINIKHLKSNKQYILTVDYGNDGRDQVHFSIK